MDCLMTNPVVTFLTTRNGYTFEEGVAVLAMYTKDRNAVERVRRSRDIRLLSQELKNLAHVPNLRAIPGMGMETKAPKPETIQPKSETIEPKSNENEPKSDESSQIREHEEPTFADLKHYKYTRYEDMPTPETQQLWLRNNDRWHVKLDLFSKMKQLPEGKELAAVRKQLVEVSREHRQCWKLIDQKCKEFYDKPAEETRHEVNFNISTYRTYICEKASAKKLSDKQFLELQRRVDAMKEANIALSEETLEKLRAKGIKC